MARSCYVTTLCDNIYERIKARAVIGNHASVKYPGLSNYL